MPKRKTHAARHPGKPSAPTSDKIYIVYHLAPETHDGAIFDLTSGGKLRVLCGCPQCLPALHSNSHTKVENTQPKLSHSCNERLKRAEAERKRFESWAECWRISKEKLRSEYCLARDIMNVSRLERFRLDDLSILAELRGVPVPSEVRSPEAVKLCNQVIAEFNGLVVADA